MLYKALILLSGSAIVIGGTAAFLLALSWGGVQFPWSDPRTLVPLVVGIIALLGFMIYERSYAKDPIVSDRYDLLYLH